MSFLLEEGENILFLGSFVLAVESAIFCVGRDELLVKTLRVGQTAGSLLHHSLFLLGHELLLFLL